MRLSSLSRGYEPVGALGVESVNGVERVDVGYGWNTNKWLIFFVTLVGAV